MTTTTPDTTQAAESASPALPESSTPLPDITGMTRDQIALLEHLKDSATHFTGTIFNNPAGFVKLVQMEFDENDHDRRAKQRLHEALLNPEVIRYLQYLPLRDGITFNRETIKHIVAMNRSGDPGLKM